MNVKELSLLDMNLYPVIDTEYGMVHGGLWGREFPILKSGNHIIYADMELHCSNPILFRIETFLDMTEQYVKEFLVRRREFRELGFNCIGFDRYTYERLLVTGNVAMNGGDPYMEFIFQIRGTRRLRCVVRRKSMLEMVLYWASLDEGNYLLLPNRARDEVIGGRS